MTIPPGESRTIRFVVGLSFERADAVMDGQIAGLLAPVEFHRDAGPFSRQWIEVLPNFPPSRTRSCAARCSGTPARWRRWPPTTNQEKTEALVMFVRRLAQPNAPGRRLPLRGLDPDHDYLVTPLAGDLSRKAPCGSEAIFY